MVPSYSVPCEYLRQKKLKKEKKEEQEPSWEDKPLQGVYHQQIHEVADTDKFY